MGRREWEGRRVPGGEEAARGGCLGAWGPKCPGAPAGLTGRPRCCPACLSPAQPSLCALPAAMENSAGLGEGGRAWWSRPEHLRDPLVLYVDAEQEELVFGGRDGDHKLRRLEEHSHTLIQLEAWATAEGHTRVSVVGPPDARLWLQELVRSLGSGQPGARARGLAMLRLVRSRPLHQGDLTAAAWGQPPPAHLALAVVLSPPCTLRLPAPFSLLLWISTPPLWSSTRL